MVGGIHWTRYELAEEKRKLIWRLFLINLLLLLLLSWSQAAKIFKNNNNNNSSKNAHPQEETNDEFLFNFLKKPSDQVPFLTHQILFCFVCLCCKWQQQTARLRAGRLFLRTNRLKVPMEMRLSIWHRSLANSIVGLLTFLNSSAKITIITS